jgi:tetratricopeptide (TPR) repeat protein
MHLPGDTPAGHRQDRPLRLWLLGLLLAGAVVFAYQPVWKAGFVWDDDRYVAENSLLTAPDGLKDIWFSAKAPSQYVPLVYTDFRFERALWGLNACGYHWVNILLHAFNALLLWRLLVRLGVPGAWLGAALFALHPVQVETVAWIAERKNILTLLFSLLTAWAWVEFIEARQRRSAWRYYALSLMLYLPALFSKATACTLPAGLLLIVWLKGQPISRRLLARIVPFVLLGVGMGIVTVWWERYHQGVAGSPLAISAIERLQIAGHAAWFYLGKLIWPAGLCFSYPRWPVDASDVLAYGWLAAGIGAGAGIVFARRFFGRGVEVAALFFLASLSPLLGFFMLSTFRYSFVADHYQYVACIGPLALAAAGLTRWLDRRGRWTPVLKPVLCGGLLLVLGVLTWRQAGMYVDIDTLWRKTIEINPDSFLAHNNLANDLLYAGRPEEAIEHYQKALELELPDGAVDYNLGIALSKVGRMDEAIVQLKRAFELQPTGAAIAYHLAGVLAARGRFEEAIEDYRRALGLQPGAAPILCGLAEVRLAKGQTGEAIAGFSRALELSPGFARAYAGLGGAYMQAGRAADAVGAYESATGAQPGNAVLLANLSWILATCPDGSVRNGSRAVELAEQAARLTGGRSPDVLKALAAAYAEAGRFADAIAAARQALELPAAQARPGFLSEVRAELGGFEAGTAVRDARLTNSSRGVNPR